MLIELELPLFYNILLQEVPCSRDAPPTYSSIFADTFSDEFTFPANDQSFIVARIPPPTYTQDINVEPSVDRLGSTSRKTISKHLNDQILKDLKTTFEIRSHVSLKFPQENHVVAITS